jgi:1-acyl-sn-glycerol-3-phosphate acyltransferase
MGMRVPHALKVQFTDIQSYCFQFFMPFGTSHEAIVQISRLALWSFYNRIEVQGEHNVPAEGPVIL